MPPHFAVILAFAMLASPLPGRAQGNVVMVNIDYFAESHRLRGAQDARIAIAAGKPEIFTDFVVVPGSSRGPGMLQNGREIDAREQVIREMGILPRPYTGGGCILNPAADAYASAYHKVTDAYLQGRFGPNYIAMIEAEVARRLKTNSQRRH